MLPLQSSPRPIRVLRDAVIVLVLVVLGGWIGAAPYDAGAADPRMVQVFQAVFGTLGFTASAYMARSRRALHLVLTTLVVWLIAGVAIASGAGHPIWWLLVLAVLALMASLGAALGLALERLSRA